MSDRKSNNYRSDILVELTEKEEGFNPRQVGWQKKHIHAICRYCGKPHRIYGANYRKNRTDFHTEGSACHNECRLKEQSDAGSPFLDPDVRNKAHQNRTKNVPQEEINKRISEGRKATQYQVEQTNMKKYGVTNPFQSEDIKEKIKQSHLLKYGVDHPQKSELVRTKTRQSFQKAISEDDDHYKLVNIMRGQQFWTMLSDNGNTLKSIAEHFGVKYKSILARVQNDEFRDRYYRTYTFPSIQQQREVAAFVSSLGLQVVENDRSIIPPLELDIYVPEKQFAIEFNGSAWHSEMKLGDQSKYKHKHKTNLCNNVGINLVHIFEETWEKRKQQWKTFLRSSLGKNQIFIPARKCLIVNNRGKELINNSHIQGYSDSTKITFDLEYNGDIVGSMTFARHHRVNDDSVIVLNRMAFKDNVTVQGGASKMFSAAKHWAVSNGYKKIISWSDNTWTRGNVYVQLGFTLVDDLGVDYFYWDSHKNTYLSKQSQRKSAVTCPDGITEHEWAKQRGLYRIWDCGKKRWEYDLSDAKI